MTVVVSMWSGPRNISTTMMRAFGNRADARAIDEPFYAYYLERTGADHPYRAETLARCPARFPDVLNLIESAGAGDILFLKQIAYHLEDGVDLSFISGWRNFLLIRDPRAMVASFSNKHDDAAPIIASYRIAARIHEYLSGQEIPCPILDADDILKEPEAVLRALCGALGIPFDTAMLAWDSGPRAEDGPWAPHWYDAVRASTGFRPYVEKKVNLSKELELLAESAMADYHRLYSRRLLA